MVVERDGAAEEIEADAVFLLTGYGADTTPAARARHRDRRRDVRPGLRRRDVRNQRPRRSMPSARWWPGVQSGRIFIENGRFHGEKVIEAIATRLRK